MKIRRCGGKARRPEGPLWYSLGYSKWRLCSVCRPTLAAGRDTLPLFLHQYEHPGYHADAAIIFGTQWKIPIFSRNRPNWRSSGIRSTHTPICNTPAFTMLWRISQSSSVMTFPPMRGDGGPYWEDGIAADAYYAAMERQNESRGPSAEKLATLTSLVNPSSGCG